MQLLEMKKGINGTFNNFEGAQLCENIWSVVTMLYEVYTVVKDITVLDEETEEDLLALFEEKFESVQISDRTPLSSQIKSLKIAPGIIQKYLLEGYINAINASMLVENMLTVYTIEDEDIKRIKPVLRKAVSGLAYGFNRQFDSFKSAEFKYTAVQQAEEKLGQPILKQLQNIEMSVPPALGILEKYPDLVEKLENVVDPYIYASLAEDLEEDRIAFADLRDILNGKVRYEDWKGK